MADKKDSKKTTPVDAKAKTDAKKKRVRKPKESLRERNVKAAEKKGKEKRVRKVANATTSTTKKIGSVLTTEYHLTERKENNEEHGFFSKSRSLAPRYFRNSWQEIKKVTWPDFRTTWKLVFAVFVFAIVIGGFIAALDWGLEKLFREIIL